MSKILFIKTFDWTPELSSWGALDKPSPYEDEEREGWFLPDGWQEHLTKRGIEFEEIEINGTEQP